MIVGLGVDLVDLIGFRQQLADPASRFVDRVFTAGERAYANRQASDDPARHLAARFAAKEAFVKAWSGGRFGLAPLQSGVDLQTIEIVNDAWGRPRIHLARGLASRVDGMTIHVSMSHDGDFAMAQVIIEDRRGGPT